MCRTEPSLGSSFFLFVNHNFMITPTITKIKSPVPQLLNYIFAFDYLVGFFQNQNRFINFFFQIPELFGQAFWVIQIS